MAAALLQYQACLGIMLRLQVEDLTLLKTDFDRVGRGLSLQEFVGVMLERVAWDAESVVPFIEDLVELFAQVDVNGDGTMEWEEFTSAIIEGGMGTMGDEVDWRDMQYEENSSFVDVLNRPPKKIHYLPEFKRVLVHDNSRPVVEIVDPTALSPSEVDDAKNDTLSSMAGAFNGSSQSDGNTNGSIFTPSLTIANKFHPLCYINGYRRDQDDMRSERSPVQALKYLSKVDLLAVSGGDLKLTFWSSTILTATSMSALETPSPQAIVHTPRPQRVLEWNAMTQHLYSISADMVITVWRVIREKFVDSKGKCEVSLFTTLKQHTDLLQDILLLNSETLVSCGMDSMIYLWDTHTLQVKATRQGHRRGVRLLTKLSNHLFLSAGFECDVLGWDIGPLSTTPVFKLWGHNSPVCCIQLIQSAAFASQQEKRACIGLDEVLISDDGESNNPMVGLLADQAITVDDDGWFKWWNLSNITSMENNDLEQNNNRCLQTFRLGSEKYPWRAHSLAVLNNGQTILAGGLHKLKLLQRVRLKPRVLPSSVVLYNSVSFTLLTTTDREIRIWDASSGTLLRTYRNIASSDISCIDLDARQRKIVFGTQRGEIIVLNYLNGAILKTWTPHQLNVSSMIYCKEDQCVLTASWDRSIRLYDDNASSNTLLRCVTDAHDADIKCLAYCYPMSLVASGSADGTIKIWDYIYFLLEDTFSLVAHSLAQSDVSTLEFIDPYPLLLSGHENGTVCCWNVSPSQTTVLLFCYTPFLEHPASANALTGSSPEAESENRGGICCCQVFYDESGGELLASDIRKGRFLVVTASIDGEICVDDFSHVIALSHLKAFREESLPSNHFGSYNPRRRFIRHGKNAKRLKNHIKNRSNTGGDNSDRAGTPDDSAFVVPNQPSVQASDVVHIKKWKAHNGSIRSLRVVDEPHTILSCSNDKTVRVWNFQGECHGTLMGSQLLKSSDSSVRNWTWDIDTAASAQLKREQAEEIWETMKGAKLKLLTQRHQSIKTQDRERRRSTLGLKTSASAPTLNTTQSTRSIHQSTKHEVLTDADRLFKQLKGEATWKQSDFQLARQVAWEKERAKFHNRMKRILKKKSMSSRSSHVSADGNREEDADDCLGEIVGIDEDVSDPTATLLPSNISTSIQELPFDDKDNWSVGGLNREKQMYSHFHHESVRRSKKVVASGEGKLRRIESSESIDLEPSAFLLEKLGSSCLVHGSIGDPLGPVKQAKKKKSTGLRHSHSVSALTLSRVPSAANFGTTSPMGVVIASSTSQRSLNGADDLSKADGSLGGALPRSLVPQQTIKELFQHYDQALQEKELEEQKLHRASMLLSIGGSSQSPLRTVDENGYGNQESPKKKPLSATRSRKSYSTPTSAKAKARRTSAGNETAEKKQRIRSDTQLLRQEHFGSYTRDDVVNIYRTFNKIDKDNSGTITLRELVDGAGLFGSNHLRDNVMSIFSSIDKDQSGHIDLKELCGAIFNDTDDEVMQDILRFYSVLASAETVKKKKKKQLSPEQLDDLKQLFKLYDADRNGDIDVDELFNALRYNEKFYDGEDPETEGTHVTKEDVQRIIARFDTDTNSTLDMNEFIELFREEL